MAPRLLFDPDRAGRAMRVAGFMSGSGTNLVKLVDHQRLLEAGQERCPFEIAFIFCDRSDGRSRAEQIALEAGIPYVSFDIRRFHQIKGARRTVKVPQGLALRREFDAWAGRLIEAFEIDLIALGGYMSFITLNRCVNVHPADLSLTNKNGQRRFVGDDAVLEAILAGQKELRSSTIWTDQGVDSGPLLMLSRPLPVNLPLPLQELKRDQKRLRQVADQHQERLKEIGDWQVFPLTIQYIAQGRFALDEDGRVFFDGSPSPQGVSL